jgi:hypothetical protein
VFYYRYRLHKAKEKGYTRNNERNNAQPSCLDILLLAHANYQQRTNSLIKIGVAGSGTGLRDTKLQRSHLPGYGRQYR